MEIQTVPLDTADSDCQTPLQPLRVVQVGQMGDQPPSSAALISLTRLLKKSWVMSDLRRT